MKFKKLVENGMIEIEKLTNKIGVKMDFKWTLNGL